MPHSIPNGTPVTLTSPTGRTVSGRNDGGSFKAAEGTAVNNHVTNFGKIGNLLSDGWRKGGDSGSGRK